MGAFDTDPGIRPSSRTYVADRAPWDPILYDIPRHHGPLPGPRAKPES